LQQVILLTAIQIPVLTITVHLEPEQTKMLLRISTLLAKLEDLSPCIFQLQIQPRSEQLSPILALSTHRKVLDILLNHTFLIPKATVQQIKQIYGETDNKKTELLVANLINTYQVDYLALMIFLLSCLISFIQNVYVKLYYFIFF